MHRLVCSGLARPGQTGWQLIDSFALDVVLDLAYGMLIDGVEPETKKKIDSALGLSKAVQQVDTTPVVEKELSDGRVVQISEARLARIRANAGGIRKMTKDKR